LLRELLLRVQASCLVLLCISACRGAPETPRNLLLISIDTLRPDHLGSYGYGRPTSPFLDRFAREGVVFERAYSTASWTVPAHASMLTGHYPRSHGMRAARHVLGGSIATLAEILQRSRFSTAGIVNVHLLRRGTGFERGFDHWLEVAPDDAGSAPRISASALDWLDHRDERPFLLFLHYYDVHTPSQPNDRYRKLLVDPYDGPANGTTEQLHRHRSGEIRLDQNDARHLSQLYDAEIRQLDAELEQLFAELERRDVLDDTLVVITSDHGDEFLEHGDFMHSRTLYEELVRIPLLMRGPGIPRGLRVPSPVSLVDLVPTVVPALGAAVPEGVEGVDLAGAWRTAEGLRRARFLFFDADEWYGNSAHDFLRAVLAGPMKLVLDGKTEKAELYDLAKDPRETRNLAGKDGRLVSELVDAIASYRRGARPSDATAPLTPETASALEALGYVTDQ